MDTHRKTQANSFSFLATHQDISVYFSRERTRVACVCTRACALALVACIQYVRRSPSFKRIRGRARARENSIWEKDWIKKDEEMHCGGLAMLERRCCWLVGFTSYPPSRPLPRARKLKPRRVEEALIPCVCERLIPIREPCGPIFLSPLKKILAWRYPPKATLQSRPHQFLQRNTKTPVPALRQLKPLVITWDWRAFSGSRERVWRVFLLLCLCFSCFRGFFLLPAMVEDGDRDRENGKFVRTLR